LIGPQVTETVILSVRIDQDLIGQRLHVELHGAESGRSHDLEIIGPGRTTSSG
jgi:hypothetical protein